MKKCKCDSAECITAIHPEGAVITTAPMSNKIKVVSCDINTPFNGCDYTSCTVRKLIHLIFSR